ncbi:MAG: TIGR03663 family protein, partial [Chloroflexota bacterium]|nr:TIGR03663 family protein [Chloroflexota bacterium]
MKEKRMVAQTATETPGATISGGERLIAFLDRPLLTAVRINWETVAWVVLIAVAFGLRIYDVGVRAMSHDESLHALYSYYLYNEGRYEHNPMMHGPLLFHLDAIAYFLFGDNDATARLFPVLAGTAIIGMAWFFRRYIGRTGALLAAVLFTISPSLLFHSRYIRDDIYIALFLLIWIYGAFRYLDTRDKKWLTVITLGMVFGILAMEAHFISGAILGVFFAGLALWQVIGHRVFYAGAPPFVGFWVWFAYHEQVVALRKQIETLRTQGEASAQAAADLAPQLDPLVAQATQYSRIGLAALGIGALIALVLLVVYVKRDHWRRLRVNPSLDLAVFMLTLVMPFTAPFGHLAFGWDAMAYATNQDMLRSFGLVLAATLLSATIAYCWFEMRAEDDPEARATLIDLGAWGRQMILFWVIAILFFTTFLTNTKNGLATGIVGSLGYWLAQQEVKRGGQPLYYYL